RQAAGELERERLKRLLHVPTATVDGVKVGLFANIERPEEAERALAAGAEGVGLFRTEFLFMNRRDLPDEDEQFEAYRVAVAAMQGRPVTIRTLDVGADKAVPALGGTAPQNPALGQRAIRYCLAEPAVFLVQPRAILCTSAFGNARLRRPLRARS